MTPHCYGGILGVFSFLHEHAVHYTYHEGVHDYPYLYMFNQLCSLYLLSILTLGGCNLGACGA